MSFPSIYGQALLQGTQEVHEEEVRQLREALEHSAQAKAQEVRKEDADGEVCLWPQLDLLREPLCVKSLLIASPSITSCKNWREL